MLEGRKLRAKTTICGRQWLHPFSSEISLRGTINNIQSIEFLFCLRQDVFPISYTWYPHSTMRMNTVIDFMHGQGMSFLLFPIKQLSIYLYRLVVSKWYISTGALIVWINRWRFFVLFKCFPLNIETSLVIFDHRLFMYKYCKRLHLTIIQ